LNRFKTFTLPLLLLSSGKNRGTTGLPLNEVYELFFVYNWQLIRSSVYRTFSRNHIKHVHNSKYKETIFYKQPDDV